MRRLATSLAILLAVAVVNPALAGIQVTTCDEVEEGVMRYTFFACAPNIDANDLHIELFVSEIGQGEEVVGCGVPNLPGFSCNSTATEASYFFPTIGPFDCVPDLPGDANKFVIDIATADGLTLVQEVWTLDGVQVAGFISVIACPPISVEDQSFGRVKALYR